MSYARNGKGLKGRQIFAVRMIGVSTDGIAAVLKTNVAALVATLQTYVTLAAWSGGAAMLNGSFQITPEAHAALKLPKSLTLLADNMAHVGIRAREMLLKLLGRDE